jgi:ABC-type glucose/galactose transport system permease subunit
MKKISAYKGPLGFRFESDPVVINATPMVLQVIPHELGAIPSIVRAVFACVADDARWGLVAGQEIDIHSVTCFVPQVGPSIHIYSDDTNIYLAPVFDSLASGNEDDYYTSTLRGSTTAGNAAPTSWANFVLKAYAYK